jgi:DNA damage-binding protein 1
LLPQDGLSLQDFLEQRSVGTTSHKGTSVNGTLGVVLGLDSKTSMFFSCLERAMAKAIRPVGDLDHRMFRVVEAKRRVHPTHGFVDGDLVESFLDLDHASMEAVVREMNRDGGWEVDDDDMMMPGRGSEEKYNTVDNAQERSELSMDEVLAMVEEMTMLH